jgi:hypothetical protein
VLPWLTVAALPWACVFVGCGKDAQQNVPTFPVTGTISFQGQPIPGAFVTLHPIKPVANAPTPRASVAADGSLRVSTYNGGDGAPEGDYVLTVEWYKPIRNGTDLVAGPNVIPKKYASPRTSDLKVRVAAEETRISPISL